MLLSTRKYHPPWPRSCTRVCSTRLHSNFQIRYHSRCIVALEVKFMRTPPASFRHLVCKPILSRLALSCASLNTDLNAHFAPNSMNDSQLSVFQQTHRPLYDRKSFIATSSKVSRGIGFMRGEKLDVIRYARTSPRIVHGKSFDASVARAVRMLLRPSTREMTSLQPS